MLTLIMSADTPRNANAEEAVLGALLLDNAGAREIGGLLSEADFHYLDHRLVYRRIMRMIEEGEPTDVLTVAGELEIEHPMHHSDWTGFLAGIAQNTPAANRIRHYAGIVRELALARRNAPHD